MQKHTTAKGRGPASRREKHEKQYFKYLLALIDYNIFLKIIIKRQGLDKNGKIRLNKTNKPAL
jgi:hypothetical protein